MTRNTRKKQGPEPAATAAAEPNPFATPRADIASEVFRETMRTRPPRNYSDLASLARDLADAHFACETGDIQGALDATSALRHIERRALAAKPILHHVRTVAAAARESALATTAPSKEK